MHTDKLLGFVEGKLFRKPLNSLVNSKYFLTLHTTQVYFIIVVELHT